MSDTADIADEGGVVHSNLGPSGAHRWMACAGSNNLVKKLGPEAKGRSIKADEGTAAHSLFAKCLLTNTDTWEYAGDKIDVTYDGLTNSFIVDPEMVEKVQETIDWVRYKIAKLKEHGKDPILLVEQRVHSPDDDEAFGTSDVVILVPKERLIIADLKYGAGVAVEPDDEQLRIYGHYSFETFPTFGALWKADPEMSANGVDTNKLEGADEVLFPDPNTVCELYILQPRIPHPKGTVRKHITSKQELSRFFHGEVLPAMQATRDKNALLNIGDHCRFCPASMAKACPALFKEIAAIAVEQDPVTLTDEELGATMKKCEQIAKLHEKLRAEALARSLAGRKVAFYKLVRQLANRIFKDGAEADIVLELGEEAYTPRVLKSPAQIEKIKGGKELVARWSMKPQTGLTLAPETDKREACKPDMLADIGNDGNALVAE